MEYADAAHEPKLDALDTWQVAAVEAILLSRERAMDESGIEPDQVWVSIGLRGLFSATDAMEVCGMVVTVDYRLVGCCCYCRG